MTDVLLDGIGVEPREIGGRDPQDEGQARDEAELVLGAEHVLVEDHVHGRDQQEHPEPGEQQSLDFPVFVPVDPLEDAHREEGDCDGADQPQVEDRQVEVAVHPVVQRRERRTRNQHVDPRVVEPQEDLVGGARHRVEQVEDRRAQQAEHRRPQEHEDRPPGDEERVRGVGRVEQVRTLRVRHLDELFREIGDFILERADDGAMQVVAHRLDLFNNAGDALMLELLLGGSEIQQYLMYLVFQLLPERMQCVIRFLDPLFRGVSKLFVNL